MTPTFYDFANEIDMPQSSYVLGGDIAPRTTGNVHTDRVSASFYAKKNLSSDHTRSAGVLITQPEQDDFTPYRVSCSVSTDQNIQAILHYGLAHPQPSDDANGQKMDRPTVLFSGRGGFQVDQVICLPNPGVIGSTDYSQRALCFAFTFLNPTAATIAASFTGSMSVERMVTPSPRWLDRRIA